MSKKYQVETHCDEITQMLRDVAVKHGWQDYAAPAMDKRTPWLVLDDGTRQLEWNQLE